MLPSLLLALGVGVHWLPEAAVPGLPLSGALFCLAALLLSPPRQAPPTTALVALVLAWPVASLLWSVDRGQTAFTLLGWVGWAALVLGPRSARRVIALTVSAAVIWCALLSAWQLLSGFDAVSAEALAGLTPEQQTFARLWAARARVLGPFSSPDALAGVLVCALPIAASLLLQPAGSGTRLLALMALAAGIPTLLMTRSGGGAVSMAAGMVAAGGVYLWTRGRRRLVVALFIAGLAMVATLVAMRGLSTEEGLLRSLHERWADYRNALHLMAQHPLLGVGAGAYESAFNAYSPAGRRYSAFAHNAVLQLGVELGVPGLLLGVVMYGGMALLALRTARRSAVDAALAAGVLAGCAHHQVDFDLHIVSGAALFTSLALLRMRRPSMSGPSVVHHWARAASLAVLVPGVVLCVGAAQSERGVPRLATDIVDVERTARGASMLWFDARAQLALADDLMLQARRTPSDALWDAYRDAARRASVLAPMHPAGPMMLARLALIRGHDEEALAAYAEAIRRSCCSRRLHEERRELALKLGLTELAAEDEAWLARPAR